LPDDPDRKLELGNALALLGRHQEARRVYEEVIRVDSLNAEAYQRLGYSLMAEESYLAAILMLQESMNRRPGEESNAFIWGATGHAYHKIGNHCTAVAAFRRALQADPEYFDFHSDHRRMWEVSVGEVPDASACERGGPWPD
jgi:tetratricopeptide (TPR) repeat protein